MSWIPIERHADIACHPVHHLEKINVVQIDIHFAVADETLTFQSRVVRRIIIFYHDIWESQYGASFMITGRNAIEEQTAPSAEKAGQ